MWGYIFAILLIALGFMFVWKTHWFVENFGRSSWAEANLGNGGTYNMYKFGGILMIILTIMGMTGLLGELFLGFFGRLFGIA